MRCADLQKDLDDEKHKNETGKLQRDMDDLRKQLAAKGQELKAVSRALDAIKDVIFVI